MAILGFFGLGAMGLPMAKRLCAAGHQLQVAVHANPDPIGELEALGARVVSNPAQVAAGADCLFSILPEDRQMLEVLLAPAVMEAVHPGAVLVEMTTACAATVRQVAKAYAPRRVQVLDAPVSGGVDGAADGTLTIMCGGEAEVLESVRPLLGIMGKNIHLVGPLGAGKNLKAVNNLLAAANTVLVAEALQLARKMDLDLDIAHQVIGASSGRSNAFDTRFPKMAAGTYTGGFKLGLMMKDMRIALADTQGLAMPMSQLACQLYELTSPNDRDCDFAAVARIFEKRS